MTLDIVIPHMNTKESEEYAPACLKSIRECTKDYQLIWIQNGGDPPKPILKELLEHSTTYLISNGKNEGFVRAANQGLRETTASRVVLMNNDTLAVPGWAEVLDRGIDWPVVMCGPRTTAQNCWQGQWPHKQGYAILPTTAMLAFFCTMFDRRVFHEVGFLDEDFGVGFGDDDNYCARVHKAGLRMSLAQGLVIPHRHRSTFRAVYTEQQIQAMQTEAMRLHFEKLKEMG